MPASVTDPDFRIEIWDPQDSSVIPDILVAASQAHGIPQKSVDWFKWKFRDSPWGSAIVVYARSSGGQLAGAVAFGRYRLSAGGSEVEAGVSYETFVHPRFQRRGLFRRILGMGEREAQRRGLEILFNFPNRASQPSFRQGGWSEIGGIQTWLRPTNLLQATRVLAVNSIRRESFEPRPPVVDQIDILRGELESVPRPISASKSSAEVISRLHDPEFLAWRFSSFQLFDYKLIQAGKSSALIRLGTRSRHLEAQVLDVFCGASPNRRSLGRLLREVMSSVSPTSITILSTRYNPISAFLPFLGFIRIPNRVNFFSKRLTSDRQFDDPDQWSLSGVDVHTW